MQLYKFGPSIFFPVMFPLSISCLCWSCPSPVTSVSCLTVLLSTLPSYTKAVLALVGIVNPLMVS